MNLSVLSLLRRAARALLRRIFGPVPHNRGHRQEEEGVISFTAKGQGIHPDDGEHSHPPYEAFDSGDRAGKG